MLPQGLDKDTCHDVSTRFMQIFQENIFNLLEKYLDFQKYITQSIEHGMRLVKSFKFADFSQLYKGNVPPLLKL